MKKYWFLSLCLLLIGLPLVACAPPAAPAPELKAPAAGGQVPIASWDQKWANMLAEGKKEGLVTIYAGSWLPETQAALNEATKKKFGIDLEFAGTGQGNELVTRLEAENAAGLKVADFISTGTGPMLEMKSKGLLGDVKSLVLLPEVTDPKAWGGEMHFFDKDRTFIPMVSNVSRTILYNTDLVKKGELTSYKDLLKPQYKGKIIVSDPTVASVGQSTFAFLAFFAWNRAEAVDFFRQLVTQQEAAITRDTQLHMETMAKGKYGVALGPSTLAARKFLIPGMPVEVAFVKEGAPTSSANGTIVAVGKMAHPNAATVFINWLLSKEGQTIFARNQGSISQRTDVVPEGIDPRFLPQPGEKIVDETEESVSSRPALVSDLVEVMKQASK